MYYWRRVNVWFKFVLLYYVICVSLNTTTLITSLCKHAVLTGCAVVGIILKEG